jgi:phi LC3 family holin
MKINWKLRFKNKTILSAIVLQIISIVYMILSASNIVPAVDESTIVTIAESIIGLLVLVGVVTDPTTDGISDSTQAMGYEEPKEDE